MAQPFHDFLRQWFWFNGRIGRLNFFSKTAFVAVIIALLSIQFVNPYSNLFLFQKIMMVIIMAVSGLVGIFQMIKRLHDLGRPAGHAFQLLIPVYNFYFLYQLFFQKGEEKTNSYGILPSNDALTSFLFILPAVIIFSVFYVYPFFETFNLAMRQWDGISMERPFVWFQNFQDLAVDKIWWQSMWHAFYITIFALTIQNALAFGLALACDREIKVKNFYRIVFFIPAVLSEVVVGFVWKWILEGGMQNGQHYGLLNHFLSSTGLSYLVTDWLSNPRTALTAIAVVHSWKGFGWGFIMFLAGLQTIDRELYEAAKVDGANSWKTFWNVTVPMMLPVIVVVFILTILGSMQAFVLVLSMTNGGPGFHTEVPVTRILWSMTSTQQYGYACAMGITFGAILITLSLALKKIEGRIRQV